MLSPKQRQYLKAQAHHLKPAVHIGKAGVTEGLALELDQMLENLELIKIKINQNSLEALEALAGSLVQKVNGLQHVWTIGRTILVYRASRNNPTKYPLP